MTFINAFIHGPDHARLATDTLVQSVSDKEFERDSAKMDPFAGGAVATAGSVLFGEWVRVEVRRKTFDEAADYLEEIVRDVALEIWAPEISEVMNLAVIVGYSEREQSMAGMAARYKYEDQDLASVRFGPGGWWGTDPHALEDTLKAVPGMPDAARQADLVRIQHLVRHSEEQRNGIDPDGLGRGSILVADVTPEGLAEPVDHGPVNRWPQWYIDLVRRNKR